MAHGGGGEPTEFPVEKVEELNRAAASLGVPGLTT